MLSQAQTMANKLFSPKNKLRLGGAKKRQQPPRLEAEQQPVTITMTASHPPKARRYGDSSPARPNGHYSPGGSTDPRSRPNRCVSFDMLEQSPSRHSQRLASIVLNAQHPGYKSMRHHRVIMVALDGHVPLQSDSPLHWLMEAMAVAGDHIICVHRPRRTNKSENYVSETTKDARALFEATVGLVAAICPDLPLKVTLEYGIGSPAHRMIQSLIGLYAPSMLVMGPSEGEIDTGVSSLVNSLGRDAIKHSLQYSQVPVIVARPDVEREAHREERRNDRSYADILQEACGGGGLLHESDWKDTGGLILYPEEVIRSRESSGPGDYDDDRLRRGSETVSEEMDDSDEGGEFEVVSGEQLLLGHLELERSSHCIPGGTDATPAAAAESLLLIPRQQQEGPRPVSERV
ncbi:unnamed protein product [Clonostachys rosea]|uniref:UspA domain-containing protein n=1 Tax=Bionectria ochroleuca TaxID=29856 RepID=A0ABY6U8F1_BIOOC|nr:unnamed protein product [Clonostachys rosea]